MDTAEKQGYLVSSNAAQDLAREGDVHEANIVELNESLVDELTDFVQDPTNGSVVLLRGRRMTLVSSLDELSLC